MNFSLTFVGSSGREQAHMRIHRVDNSGSRPASQTWAHASAAKSMVKFSVSDIACKSFEPRRLYYYYYYYYYYY